MIMGHSSWVSCLTYRAMNYTTLAIYSILGKTYHGTICDHIMNK